MPRLLAPASLLLRCPMSTPARATRPGSGIHLERGAIESGLATTNRAGLERSMTDHPIVSREEWLAARIRHLAEEKEFTRRRDELSRHRRELPWVKIGDYTFDSAAGKVRLSDLFRGK